MSVDTEHMCFVCGDMECVNMCCCCVFVCAANEMKWDVNCVIFFSALILFGKIVFRFANSNCNDFLHSLPSVFGLTVALQHLKKKSSVFQAGRLRKR